MESKFNITSAVIAITLLLILLAPLPYIIEGKLYAFPQDKFFINNEGVLVIAEEIHNTSLDRRAAIFPLVGAWFAHYPSGAGGYSKSDLFYSKFNLPYYANLPVRIEEKLAPDGDLSLGIASSPLPSIGKDKPADLIVISTKLEQEPFNDRFTTWSVKVELFNNNTKPATETYVLVSLRNSEGRSIDVIVDRSPITIGPKESKNMIFEDVLPLDRKPTSVYVYAESKESTVYYENMFPLRREVTIMDESGGFLQGIISVGKSVNQFSKTIDVGDKVIVKNNLFNYVRNDISFFHLIQVSKVIDPNSFIAGSYWGPWNAKHNGTNLITEEIIVNEFVIGANDHDVNYAEWVPSNEGLYLIQTYVWSDLQHPVPLDSSYTGNVGTITLVAIINLDDHSERN